MPIRELFSQDVARDIPPVVYFHEQSPNKLLEEVSEYIITGGWPENHPNRKRVPDGIHEQYVRLLTAVTSELEKPGGPELPTAWISGFYGSGKSSFAKLLGLALDGVALPDGRSLAKALLERDTSLRAAELRDAWDALKRKIDPLAVVFDIGAVARDNEQIHAVAVRQLASRLDYCGTEPLVAAFELGLERDGQYKRFLQLAEQTLGRPWSEVKDKALAEEDFSLVMSVMFPERYTDPMSWFTSRGGTKARADSPEDAVRAIGDMLKFRRPEATLFFVIDEVSQYIVSHKDRVDRLRAFTSALGSTLKGRAWLFALGQQKLDEGADDSFLIWAKDRFPPKLRVHLAPTNIRDVVHRRLLQKKPGAEGELRVLFEASRSELKLYGYQCESLTPEEFVEVYPMLPGHIDLLLQITSALRMRSSRAQGDDQAIRGLLQLLGEMFRSQGLAEMPVGALVTLDRIYEVQHTALDSEVQANMARILTRCADDETGLLVRVAKAVALLELVCEAMAVKPELVAQCLYDRVDRGNQIEAIERALLELKSRGLLGYSEQYGYKIQSSTSEEWSRERNDIGVPGEAISELVTEMLKKHLLTKPETPKLKGRSFPWAGVLSDGRKLEDVVLVDRREDAVVRVDFRYIKEERTESIWVRRSAETALKERLVWVCGEHDQVEHYARELFRSRAMVKKYKPRRESLNGPRKTLFQEEENRAEELEPRLSRELEAAFVSGRMYFRGRPIPPTEHGSSFASICTTVASHILPDLFPHFVITQLSPSELLQLIEPELSGLSPKLLTSELGILDLDSGRYVPSCAGVVPSRVREHIEAENGASGAALLAHFGAPPYGYTANIVKACVAGLLRAGLLKIEPEGGAEITAIRDAGVRDLFDKDRPFRAANVFPAGEDDIGFKSRAKICKFFETVLHHTMERDDNAIADAVSHLFPSYAARLRSVLEKFNRLPGRVEPPGKLLALSDALEECVAKSRQTKPTVRLVKQKLDGLSDGFELLHIYDAELTDEAIASVRQAADVRDHQLAQLEAFVGLTSEVQAAAEQLQKHLSVERPWRDISALDGALSLIRAAYAAERGRLLQLQEQQVEMARARVKARPGFSTLTADQSHKVLRPLATASTNTTVDAVAPSLEALKDPFLLALQRAESDANDRLDEILSEIEGPVIQRIDLKLKNREIGSQEDVEALLDEIRKRLLEQLASGDKVRVRLV